MGDPRKTRKKYSGPKHPWEASRIDEERIILKKYGLRNKKEIWKMQAMLKRFKRQAKNLITRRDQQAEKEQVLLMKKLHRLGLAGKDAKIESVLGLTLDDVMKLRLQTAVFNKGIARSISQSRQLIVHGHINIAGRTVTVPSYILESGEEDKVAFGGGFAIEKSSLGKTSEKLLEKSSAEKPLEKPSGKDLEKSSLGKTSEKVSPKRHLEKGSRKEEGKGRQRKVSETRIKHAKERTPEKEESKPKVAA